MQKVTTTLNSPGNFYEAAHIKGKFRIKVQHDLQ